MSEKRVSQHRTNQDNGLTMTRCPAPPDLLLYALQLPDDREPRDTAHHVSRCPSCQATVTGIREIIGALQPLGAVAAESEACLDEMTVASLVEHGVDVAGHPEIVAHLATCAECREQVASVARLLRGSSVAAEIERIAVSNAQPVSRRWRIVGTGSLTALAAAAALMVAQSGDRVGVTEPPITVTDSQTHREPSMTTTVAPSLIAPIGAAAADTFRWTSVPRADRYRLTVFDREGAALWEVEGSDTAIARPESIAGQRGTAYLWKVEARTGWDRWVASELVEFSSPPNARIP